MTDKLNDGHEHTYSINFGYEQIECVQYQHGCDVMIEKDEAERRINEFPACCRRVERLKEQLQDIPGVDLQAKISVLRLWAEPEIERRAEQEA